MKLADYVKSVWSGARETGGRHEKTTVVVCPPLQMPAEIGLDRDNRMESCSRLPESGECSESCMAQVQFSAEKATDFAARYEGKKCTSCGVALTQSDWYRNRLEIVKPRATTADSARSAHANVPGSDEQICAACFGLKRRAG